MDRLPASTRTSRALLLWAAVTLFCPPVSSADEFMPTDALLRGMTGYGLTVFQGTRIDTFQVEILGVLKNFRPKSDLVLARLSGGPLEKAGVIQGMSGSPVYVDGRLVGAVSYSIAIFAREPIAGITPIADMTEMWDRAQPGGTVESIDEASGMSPGRSGQVALDAEVQHIRPIGTPLVVSGMAAEVLPELRKELAPLGLNPVQGGGAAGTDAVSVALEPGAALGVQLARGDVSMTGIGTVTHRDGDRVLGLGHPAYWVGTTSMPMTGAYIHDILASQMQSFKLGVATGPVGVIEQDRAYGVSGRVGAAADMLPTEIRVRSSHREAVYRVEVWRHRDFAPLVIRQAAASALFTEEKPGGRTTLRATARLEIQGREPVEVTNVYSGPLALGQAVLGATTPLALVMGNSFERVRVERVTIDLDVAEHQEVAAIASVRLARSRYAPGDEVEARTVLRPEFGQDEVVTTRLRIPDRIRPGRLLLRVSSANAHRKAEVKRVPGAFVPGSLDHLLRLIEMAPRNDQLIVEMVGPPQGVSLDGRELRGLPPSVLTALRSSAASGTVGPVSQGVLAGRRIRTDYVLSGSRTVMIAVDGQVNGAVMEKADSGDKKRK